ncbi:SDR family oxidoreductase [Furfurilactobacillus sp. WILCCON 0119]
MKIFITGGSGFIGQTVVKDLVEKNYDVVGLARSDRSAAILTSLGATPVSGTLTDHDVLAQQASASDGVIHLGFTNDFNHYDEAVKQDQAAIKAIGDALIGSNKPFVNTSGTLMITDLGRPALETDFTAHPTDRALSEANSLAYADQGVRAMVVRLSPTVHSAARQGFGSLLAQIAVAQHRAAFVDETTVWPSVHRDDAAALFAAALERGTAGHVYHAVAEEGISVKAIEETIATSLHLPISQLTPQDAATYFGWFVGSISANNPTSSAQTQAELDWHPTHEGLLTDLADFLAIPANVEQLNQAQ